jgi:adenylylsulfate kinase
MAVYIKMKYGSRGSIYSMIIQVIGLPGSGKTTFAKELADRINAIHLNADDIRAELNKDLGFTTEDRL